MKIIHCADLHLDAKMTANLTKEQARERRKEILRTFVRMVEYAARNGVRAILIAGDLFDTRNISALVRNTVRDMICSHPEIDFLYLRGNHDADSFLNKLEETPSNLLLFGSEWTTYLYGNVAVTGLELGPDNRSTCCNSLVLDQEAFNIVTLHGQIAGYGGKEEAETIGLNDLKNKGIDYLALGHVHKKTTDRLDNRGTWCYPGCLEGRGFDECGEKGFVLIDIDDGERSASYRFIPIAARTLYSVEVDVTGVKTTQEAAVRMESEIAKLSCSSGSMVKFVLTGEVDVDTEISCPYLQELFSEYFYYEKVSDRTRLSVSYSDYAQDVSLKGEFIRMVLDSELSEENKTEVIRCGLMALSGEEI